MKYSKLNEFKDSELNSSEFTSIYINVIYTMNELK